MLAELVGAHLVTEQVPGRYALHDLLRAYAGELAGSAEPQALDRLAPVRRLLDHYLQCAHRAEAILSPARDAIELVPPLAGVTVDTFESAEAATDWFSDEYQVLLAAVPLAVDAGLDRHAWQLAWSMAPFLDRRDFRDAAAIQRIALQAAQRLGDPAAQGFSHLRCGRIYTLLGEFDEAQVHLEQALEAYRQAGNDPKQGDVRRGLGGLLERQGRHRDALHQVEQALARYQASGHRVGQAYALNDIGWAHAQLGDYEKALAYCGQALELAKELGFRQGEADSWDSLGFAYHHLGRHAEAVAAYQQALALFRDLGNRYLEAETLVHLGEAYQASGDAEAALDRWRSALAILTDLDHPDADKVRARLGLDIRPNLAG